MLVWLIKAEEMLPTDGANARLGRMGLLAEALVSRGNEVVRWASTFIHYQNKQRFNKDITLYINERYKIHLIHSLSYKRTRSLLRVINNFHIALKFFKYARKEKQPDIIVCSSNNIIGLISIKYAKKRGIPSVLDIRDLWPDALLETLPPKKRNLAKVASIPIDKLICSACKEATAITGITPAFVEWGIKKANRHQTYLDRHFPLGYSEKVPDEKDIIEAKNFWLHQRINKNNKKFIDCFLGTMNSYFELDVIIKTARKLKLSHRKFRFVFCGYGDMYEMLRILANECENIVFPGWINAAEIWTLLRISSVGLTPYKSIDNFVKNIPNKPIEYLSAGLPIVSSLKGELQKLLTTYDCGVTYENGNVDELVSILCDLYDNPERLKIMSKNVYSLFKEKFVAEKIYDEMSRHLEKVVEMDRTK